MTIVSLQNKKQRDSAPWYLLGIVSLGSKFCGDGRSQIIPNTLWHQHYRVSFHLYLSLQRTRSHKCIFLFFSPGLYTRVGEYIPWIRQIITSYQPNLYNNKQTALGKPSEKITGLFGNLSNIFFSSEGFPQKINIFFWQSFI